MNYQKIKNIVSPEEEFKSRITACLAKNHELKYKYTKQLFSLYETYLDRAIVKLHLKQRFSFSITSGITSLKTIGYYKDEISCFSLIDYPDAVCVIFEYGNRNYYESKLVLKYANEHPEQKLNMRFLSGDGNIDHKTLLFFSKIRK